jgi:hypothetical protein
MKTMKRTRPFDQTFAADDETTGLALREQVEEIIAETLEGQPDREPFPGARERLQSLTEALQAHLGLTDWRIRARFHPSNTEFRAQLNLDRHFHQATVYVCEAEPVENWDLTVAHELLHLLLDPLSYLLKRAVGHLDSRAKQETFATEIADAEEPIMNRLAEIIIGRPWPYTFNQEL